jgi:hypothetical protein
VVFTLAATVNGETRSAPLPPTPLLGRACSPATAVHGAINTCARKLQPSRSLLLFFSLAAVLLQHACRFATVTWCSQPPSVTAGGRGPHVCKAEDTARTSSFSCAWVCKVSCRRTVTVLHTFPIYICINSTLCPPSIAGVFFLLLLSALFYSSNDNYRLIGLL